jgi:hypothetical protein
MRFDNTLRTEATPEDVWAVWTDVARWPEWDVELESASIKGGQLALGASGTLRPRRGAISSFVVSEVVPKEGYAFATRLPLCELVVRRRLRKDGDGGTAFTHESRSSGRSRPSSVLAWVDVSAPSCRGSWKTSA